MLNRILLFVAITFTTQVSAQVICTGDNLRAQASYGGFCVYGAQLTPEDSTFLSTKILSLKRRFPGLFARIFAKGYHDILIQPAAVGESGGAVLGEAVTEKKLLVLYRDFFTAEKQNPILQTLGYSVADVVIIHEFMHVLDDKHDITQNSLQLLGWNIAAMAPADGFQIAEIPGIANVRVTNAYIAKIKNELGPLLPQVGPWQLYVEARKCLQPFGYPTIYSVLGGPLETFAELGAYIALDPSAPSYIPLQTINWYRTQVLY